MFKKILVPLDGSKTAQEALYWAKQYAGPGKAQVVLVQVLHAEYPLEGRPFRAGGAEAREYLQGIERELNYAGIPVKILLRNEPVARSIAQTARQEGCDLIIMTSRGSSKVVRWLIGGVTQQVIRLSSVPVLVVRGSVAGAAHARPRRILVPQDGSPLARTVLPLAKELSRFHRARLSLLHVRTRNGSRRNGQGNGSVTRVLEGRAGTLRNQGFRAEVRVASGDAALEILKSSRTGDLLALSTHGYGGLKRLLLGSVAEKVIQEATVPVFIFKEPASSRRLPDDLANLELFGS